MCLSGIAIPSSANPTFKKLIAKKWPENVQTSMSSEYISPHIAPRLIIPHASSSIVSILEDNPKSPASFTRFHSVNEFLYVMQAVKCRDMSLDVVLVAEVDGLGHVPGNPTTSSRDAVLPEQDIERADGQ